MELFDLVDENDTVIGTTDREKSHADGGIHRLIAIYVFDKNGDLYVQENHGTEGKIDHGIGGHVQKGESYDDAAVREALEELGIADPIHKISTFFSDERARGNNFRHMFGLYECYPSDTWQFQATEEVANVTLMPLQEIITSMNENPDLFSLGFLNTMREYIKQKNLPFTLKTYTR